MLMGSGALAALGRDQPSGCTLWDVSDGPIPGASYALPLAAAYSAAMGTKNTGTWPADNEASWMDETLPLELRRELLDHALDRIKAGKRGGGHPSNQDQPDHPGESGSESRGHGDRSA
ncbi:MAG: hypothetical protein JWQ33_1317 [Ramlibacter sp.]|nr:hypothetical protein [Ramlibacter sp.]